MAHKLVLVHAYQWHVEIMSFFQTNNSMLTTYSSFIAINEVCFYFI